MLKNSFKTAILLAGLGALFMVVGAALGGSTGLTIGLVLGLVLCGGSYWFSDKLAISAARAKPVTEEDAPQLHAMVRDLARASRSFRCRGSSCRPSSNPTRSPPDAVPVTRPCA